MELLLALTILSLAGALAYSFLSTAFVSWNSGVERGRRGQVAGIVASRLAQQLKSAVPAVAEKSGRKAAAFDGGEDFIRFVTLLPLGTRALRQVSYSIEAGEEGPELVYREYPWPDKEFFSGGKHLWEERLPEISGLKVVLRASEGDEGDAAEFEAWSPGSKSFPVSAGIVLTASAAGEGQGSILELSVPLRSLPRE